MAAGGSSLTDRPTSSAALPASRAPPSSPPQIESEIRRGKDYVRVAIVMTIAAADVADALDFAWSVFRQAACDDAGGWDMAAVSAEVRPGGG